MREARAMRFPLNSGGGLGPNPSGPAPRGVSGGMSGGGQRAEFDDAPIPIEGDDGPRRMIRPTGASSLGAPPSALGGSGVSPGATEGADGATELSAAPIAPVGTPVTPGSKIRSFDQGLLGKRHEDEWSRTPNTTGTGAIHCKSFHCKLNEEGLLHLDAQINEWLDAHPQYEVKLVHSSIGEWQTKTSREPNLIVQVWV